MTAFANTDTKVYPCHIKSTSMLRATWRSTGFVGGGGACSKQQCFPANWERITQAKMASHLIETSEEDSFLAVARYLGDLLAEGQVSRQHPSFVAAAPGCTFFISLKYVT
jgi:hypothetical protein